METRDPDALIEELFREHAGSLVRMARLFADDRNAAEDLVQEAFLRLRRALHRIEHPEKAVAYLRSIVLNLARDHNRRGLVSLRHRPPVDEVAATHEDRLVMKDEERRVIEALAALPRRQRDCLTLRYYLELTNPAIAETLGVSVNSVKTHLRRGMATRETRLEGRA